MRNDCKSIKTNDLIHAIFALTDMANRSMENLKLEPRDPFWRKIAKEEVARVRRLQAKIPEMPGRILAPQSKVGVLEQRRTKRWLTEAKAA